MRKNRLFVLGIITMFVAILSLTLVSGTMARYTSKVSGESTAKVAKWEFQLNDVAVTNNAIGTPQTVTFDLFKTIKDSDGTSDEDDVKNGGSENLIAPGTSGSFQLKIENLSQVNATYAIDYSITNNDSIPVKFKVNDGEWSSNLADVIATEIAMESGVATYTIQWEWAFDGNDNIDTDLGLDGTATITVAVAITFTQID